MEHLYELVVESRKNTGALQKLIALFEPKIKKSVRQTTYNEKEDLAQELKCKLISCIKNYDAESTPGFWEFKETAEKNSKIRL